LLIKRLDRTRRDSWLGEHLGICGSTSRRWQTKHIMDPRWTPWCNPGKGTSMKFTEQDVELIRRHLFRNQQVVNKEVTEAGILTLLQELWRASRPGQQFPEMSLSRVQMMLSRWGWSWRRAHKKRRPNADPPAAIEFAGRSCTLWHKVWVPATLSTPTKRPFRRCPHCFYTWARRGTQAIQIHVAGNEKQSYTVMVAVTKGSRKLPFVHHCPGEDGEV
jgi:hypothetical protein